MPTTKDTGPDISMRDSQASLKNWGDLPDSFNADSIGNNRAVDCGWGRRPSGQPCAAGATVGQGLACEGGRARDIAIYGRAPHVILAHAPHLLFLAPSPTSRLDFSSFDPDLSPPHPFTIRNA